MAKHEKINASLGRHLWVDCLTAVLLLVFGLGSLEPLKFFAADCQEYLPCKETEEREEEQKEEQTEIVWTLEASLLNPGRRHFFATTSQPSTRTLLDAASSRRQFSGLRTSYAKRQGLSAPMRC